MKKKLVGIVTLVSAALASVCCIGPLVLVGLGMGGLGLAAGLARYRTIFMALTFAFLGLAFYLTYRKREVQCADGSCEVKSAGARAKTLLWIVTAATLALASFPLWIGAFSSKSPVASNGRLVKLNVTGMFCPACAVSIGKALKNVPGVQSASVDFDKSEASVFVDPQAETKSDALIKAVEETGYKASLR